MRYQLDQIDPAKTVMIVVDMQNDFVAEGAKLCSPERSHDGAEASVNPQFLPGKRHPRREDGSRASTRWIRHGSLR